MTSEASLRQDIINACLEINAIGVNERLKLTRFQPLNLIHP